MTATDSDKSQSPASLKNSTLIALARQAFETVGPDDELEWPRLDFTDPTQRDFGDYELLEEIGRGGMGIVYRARQRSLDREVAIKFIADHLADTRNIARFFSEARAAARLNHPNIVPVYEVSQVDTVHFFSMPLMSGRTLATELKAGLMNQQAIISLMLKLCDALHYAHRLGLLHLDLKPENILIDDRGEPMIADFGLARRMDSAGGVDAQEVSGTPNFMAPEQIQIKQYRMSIGTDIYALGAMLYQCLTGVSPHGKGSPDELMQRSVAGRVKPISALNRSIPADLAAVTMKCLQLLQRERYQSAAQLAEDLRCVRDGLPVSVRRANAIERLRLWVKREPRFAAAASAAVIALSTGTVATAAQWNEAAAQRDVARTQRDVALEQRELAEGMAALGAWMYAQKTSLDAQDKEEESSEHFTTRMVKWLSERFPGNETLQASVVSEFARGVIAAEGDPGELIVAVIDVMGADYRQQMIRSLVAGTEPNRYAMAARLAWNDEYERQSPDQFRTLMDAAIAAQPESLEVWEIAAVYCMGMRDELSCLYDEAAQKLMELAPDNAYSWLLGFEQANGAQARALLQKATQIGYFDDGYKKTVAAYLKTVNTAQLPVPRVLSAAARVFDPDISPSFVVAAGETRKFPLAWWVTLQKRCNPSQNYFSDQLDAYADCKAIGETMARGEGSILSSMIGVSIVRRIEKDTQLAEEMIGIRRDYIYAREMASTLNVSQLLSYSWQEMHKDMMTVGELRAWQNRLAYFGIPPLPSQGWKPANPLALLLPEDIPAYLEQHPEAERWR